MTIVFDEDIPRSFAFVFRDAGFEVVDSRDHDLRGAEDERILEFSLQKNAILFTGDPGFLRLQQKPKGIIINRLSQNISIALRLEALKSLLKNTNLGDLQNYITVFEIGQIRRRPLK